MSIHCACAFGHPSVYMCCTVGCQCIFFCVLFFHVQFSLFHFQELESELEALKLASQSTQQNGPVGTEETDTAGPTTREDQVQIHIQISTV